jgi:hypothetical protein
MSSLIPSALTFFQEISKNIDSCHLVNITKTQWIPIKPEPKFSVSTYFFIIFIFMCVSLISLTLIDLKFSKKMRKRKETLTRFEEKENFIENNQAIGSTQSSSVDKKEMSIFLIISFIISFFLYGILLGLQSYSTLSYGNRAFYLSINLGKAFSFQFISDY